MFTCPIACEGKQLPYCRSREAQSLLYRTTSGLLLMGTHQSTYQDLSCLTSVFLWELVFAKRLRDSPSGGQMFRVQKSSEQLSCKRTLCLEKAVKSVWSQLLLLLFYSQKSNVLDLQFQYACYNDTLVYIYNKTFRDLGPDH